jgi:hypothetical protein
MMAQYRILYLFHAEKQNVICGEMGSASISVKWENPILAYAYFKVILLYYDSYKRFHSFIALKKEFYLILL